MNLTRHIKTLFCLALTLPTGLSFGQPAVAPSGVGFGTRDSVAVIRSEAVADAVENFADPGQVERSDEFYNRLEEAVGNSRLTKRVFDAIVTDNSRDTTAAPSSELVDDREYFDQYAGQKIHSVRIYRNNVFEKSSSRTSLSHWANRLHVVTAESRIRNNLLFEQGGTVVPDDIIQSRHILRELSYTSDADIIMVPSGGEAGGVDIMVVTRDRWSIGGDMHSLGQSRYNAIVYDNNFLGYGNKFSVGFYVATKGQTYAGNAFEYTMPNIRGTFFQGDIYAGEGYYEQKYGGRISRMFIRPDDYMAGAILEQVQDEEWIHIYDSSQVVRWQNMEFWYGKSFYSKGLRSSFFVIGGYHDIRFPRRPEVSPGYNTLYHDHRSALLSTGLYREAYYNGSMIHGFGTSEDIPYGFKAELTGGRVWGEFEDRYYAGASLSGGRQWAIGYLRGELAGNTFINDKGKEQQGMLTAGLEYFSNLLPTRRAHLRQIINIYYTTGFRRRHGEGETLSFFDIFSPRGGITTRGVNGNSRLLINTETVRFSPWYWYGFRYAVYGYWDSAFIGPSSAVFKNAYYSIVGVGIRVHNERLIFRTIQLRFGIALGPGGMMDSSYFRATGEATLTPASYKPVAPAVRQFR